ncbi:MAG: triose-phosphate isomerase [Proteobacteria bacterium]|nr:triose-phosphate isomerase [Pseudomonadota bacterium]
MAEAAKRKPIIIGNWKMYKTVGEALDLVGALLEALPRIADLEVGVAPPFTALAAVARKIEGSKSASGGSLLLAAQNCHFEAAGAFTGEVAPPMLKEVGCTHVIVGHSERRQFFGDTDELVNKKTRAAFAHGLTPVICVGELLAEREAGQTFEVVERQLRAAFAGVDSTAARRAVVAYEPVWAIGTGRTATDAQAQEVHAFLRRLVGELYDGATAGALRIQYGGSVKAENAAGLMAQPDVDGALVGGASLKPEAFLGILEYRRTS